jgi:hypothetical protein
MSFESLAKEATQRAKGDAAMVEVPEVEDVMRERRNQHRTKQTVAGGLVVVALFGAVSAAIALRGSGGQSSHPQVVTQPTISPPLEFREVLGILPYSSRGLPEPTTITVPSTTAHLGSTATVAAVITSCGDGAAVTPPDQITPDTKIILPDRPDKQGMHHVCYLLGPRRLDGSGIGKVVVTYDSGQQGYIIDITFKNDDVVTKVARPLTNKDVAIVVDGVVQSAPNLQPGITGRVVQISGNYTKSSAVALAASLLGVKPSQVSAPSGGDTPPPTTFTEPKGLSLGEVSGQCNNAPGSSCTGEMLLVASGDIVAVTVRQTAPKHWVVEVQLAPQAVAQWRGKHLGATVLRDPMQAVLHGSTVELRPIDSTSWNKTEARAVAQAIRAGN